MQNRFALLIPVFALLALASCGNSTTPSVPQWGYLHSVVGTAVLPDRDSTFSILYAQFQDGSASTFTAIPVDSLSMNGLAIPYSGTPQNIYTIADTIPLPGDPQFTWHVVGKGKIPSFDNTMTSPAHLRVNLPHPNDTVFRLNGVVVNWGPIVTGGTVYLEVDDNYGHTWPTSADGLQAYTDGGAAIITGSNLLGLKPGPIKIFVYRLVAAQKQVGQELFDYQCFSESVVPAVMMP